MQILGFEKQNKGLHLRCFPFIYIDKLILLFNIKHQPGAKLLFPNHHSQVSQENAFPEFQEECGQKLKPM